MPGKKHSGKIKKSTSLKKIESHRKLKASREIETYTKHGKEHRWFLRWKDNNVPEEFKGQVEQVEAVVGDLYRLLLGDRCPKVRTVIGENGKVKGAMSKELPGFRTLSESCKKDGVPSNQYYAEAGLGSLLAACYILEENDLHSKNYGYDILKRLVKIDHDMSLHTITRRYAGYMDAKVYKMPLGVCAYETPESDYNYHELTIYVNGKGYAMVNFTNQECDLFTDDEEPFDISNMDEVEVPVGDDRKFVVYKDGRFAERREGKDYDVEYVSTEKNTSVIKAKDIINLATPEDFIPINHPKNELNRFKDLSAFNSDPVFNADKWKVFLKSIFIEGDILNHIVDAHTQSPSLNKELKSYLGKRMKDLHVVLSKIPEFRNYLLSHPEMIETIKDELHEYNKEFEFRPGRKPKNHVAYRIISDEKINSGYQSCLGMVIDAEKKVLADAYADLNDYCREMNSPLPIQNLIKEIGDLIENKIQYTPQKDFQISLRKQVSAFFDEKLRAQNADFAKGLTIMSPDRATANRVKTFLEAAKNFLDDRIREEIKPFKHYMPTQAPKDEKIGIAPKPPKGP